MSVEGKYTAEQAEANEAADQVELIGTLDDLPCHVRNVVKAYGRACARHAVASANKSEAGVVSDERQKFNAWRRLQPCTDTPFPYDVAWEAWEASRHARQVPIELDEGSSVNINRPNTYAAGWNDCRPALLAAAPTAPKAAESKS